LEVWTLQFPDRWIKRFTQRKEIKCFIKNSHAPETFQRILVIKDNLSLFVELIPCREVTAFVVAQALLDWYKTFGLDLYHVSDQITHFKNQVILNLIA
jgi:hypothetical protein